MTIVIDSLVTDPDPERHWDPEGVGAMVVTALQDGNEVHVINVRSVHLSIAYQFSVTRLADKMEIECEVEGNNSSLLFKRALK